jgi:hypothetical protein
VGGNTKVAVNVATKGRLSTIGAQQTQPCHSRLAAHLTFPFVGGRVVIIQPMVLRLFLAEYGHALMKQDSNHRIGENAAAR